MQNLLRRLLKNETRVIVVNALFWLGLAVLLLTDPFRLTLGGALIAWVLGGTLVYAGISGRMGRGVAYPGLIQGLSIVFGLTAVIFGVWMLVRVANGSVVPRRARRRQELEARLLRVAEGSVYMDLSGLGLREVPPEAWQYTHVTWLHLGDNRLMELPPQIGNLTHLEEFYAWNNRLASLPPEIGALSRLTRLNLAGNRLRALPETLAQCERLTHVWLEHNRLRTFPAVLLELPNLKSLALTGNPMGELPDRLTLRAEAGGLELEYRSYAFAFDGAAGLVLVSTVGLPLLAAWGVDRWWTERERTARQAARRQGAVFRIPPLFRCPTLFVLFATTAVGLLMVASGLNSERTGVTIETGIALMLVLSPLIIGALALLLRHTGMVILTPEGVRLHRLGRERFVPYDLIVEIRSRARIVGPALVIVGDSQRVRIPRTVEALPQLYRQLLRRVPTATRNAALGARPSVPGSDPVTKGAEVPQVGGSEPVYDFDVDRHVWVLYIAGTVLLTLVYLGIGLLGLWLSLVQGDVPPLTWAWLRGTLILFVLTSLLFVPALVFIVRGLLTKRGPFRIEQPVALQLFHDRLRYRFPRRLLARAPRRGDVWHERPAQTLQQVTLEPIPFSARARVDGVLVSQRMTRYALLLTFEDGARLIVDRERAAQWSQTLETLRAIITQLYGL